MFNVRKSFLRRFIPYILIAEIGTFGLINTGLLISMNLTSHQFLAAEKVVQVLPGKLDEANTEQFLSNSRKSVTIVGNPYYHWIPQKVYHIDQIYTTYLSMAPLRTQYFVIIVDDRYRQSMLDGVQSERLAGLYNTTRSIAVYQGHDLDQYEGDRYYHEILKRNYEQSIEVRTNY